MDDEKKNTTYLEGENIGKAPTNEQKQELDEIELAKDENNYTAEEERKLIRKVRTQTPLTIATKFSFMCFNITLHSKILTKD